MRSIKAIRWKVQYELLFLSLFLILLLLLARVTTGSEMGENRRGGEAVMTGHSILPVITLMCNDCC